MKYNSKILRSQAQGQIFQVVKAIEIAQRQPKMLKMPVQLLAHKIIMQTSRANSHKPKMKMTKHQKIRPMRRARLKNQIANRNKKTK